MDERREWRARKAEFFRRAEFCDHEVNARCRHGWENFSAAVHREVVVHNNLGLPNLGIRRSTEALEVHRWGQLHALLTLCFDGENQQIHYRSLLHEGSVILGEDGGVAPGATGAVFLSDLDGHLRRFSYSDAARFLLAPLVGA